MFRRFPVDKGSRLFLVLVFGLVILAASVSACGTTTNVANTGTSNNTLCSGGDISSIDNSHPFHQDDGQASQGDQGGFNSIVLCKQMAASNYAISFHAMSPYLLLYLYDGKHAKYEIDYNIYPDHISVVTYPGFDRTNAITVGNGTYSSADWHTYRIEFTSNSVRVLVDGSQVLTGSAGFTDDGSGDDLLLQSHQITMDQFSVTRI
jgi:hypothetical protein